MQRITVRIAVCMSCMLYIYQMLYVMVSIGTIRCSILYVVSGEFSKSAKVLHVVSDES